MPNPRIATTSDLKALLDLFQVSALAPAVGPAQPNLAWREMFDDASVTVFISEADSKVVATCTLITAPDLLRRGQRHGFLENIVTAPGFEGKGHSRAVVEAALSAAWQMDCYRVLLQSGRARTPHFYEHCGFDPEAHTAYVARPRSPNVPQLG
jgi:GNAT superfamily N-acetyltransferase